jgi:phenylacetic acid degradation operon negative regulatory protein
VSVTVVPGAAPRPRALIVTVYGAFARELGGWLAVADLIALLAPLGVDEQSVRSSISRLKQRDVLAPERRGRMAGYALSDWGYRLVEAGDRRILARRPPAELADGWLLAVFSVPESERSQRHQLRTQLAWLGFGAAAAGVWVAPSHVLDEARDVLTRRGLARYVTFFRAEYLPAPDGASPREVVATWWDLETLRQAYAEFIAAHEPTLHAWSTPGADDAAFGDYAQALTSWRRLPYLDPRLPAETLPADWNGERAADVFFGLKELLADAALRHVRAVTTRRQT